MNGKDVFGYTDYRMRENAACADACLGGVKRCDLYDHDGIIQKGDPNR